MAQYPLQSIRSFCESFRGNWRKFESFGWHSEPEDNPDNWGIYHLDHRDSGLLDQSNSDYIRQELAEYTESQTEEYTVTLEHFGHWAVGWIDAIAVKVYDSNNEPTEAIVALYDILCRLDNYPVLDEEDYTDREYSAALSGIEMCARDYDLIIDNLPEGWQSEVHSWLSDNGYNSELENKDDTGAYPDKEPMIEALQALGWLSEEAQEELEEGIEEE